MKTNIVSLLILGLMLNSCAGSSDSGGGAQAPAAAATCASSQLVGTWTGSVNGHADTLNITTSCLITSSYCATNATMSANSSPTGVMSVNVGSYNANPGCLPVGSYTNCAYGVTANTLQYACGGGTVTYTR